MTPKDRPEFVSAHNAITKASGVIKRADDIQAVCNHLLALEPAKLQEKLDILNARTPDKVWTRQDIEYGAVGKMFEEHEALEQQIRDLDTEIANLKQRLEEGKPVETAVPRIDGHYDYRMLVDEANDAKVIAVFQTTSMLKSRAGTEWGTRAITTIPRTETFVWGPDIIKIVRATATRIPSDYRVFDERFITIKPQWWWWGVTIGQRLGLYYRGVETFGQPDPVICGVMVEPNIPASLDNAQPRTSVFIHLLISPMGKDVVLATPVVWQYNTEVGELAALYNKAEFMNAEIAYTLVAAGLSWMSQKTAVVTPHQVGRGTRKRADVQKVIHTTSVVQLRRTESVKHEGEGRTVDWSHRWMVSEFHRNQWYPSTGKHERILIAAFVKGPADKPLVIKDRVFVVNR